MRTLGGEGVCRTPHNSEGLDPAARREPQPFWADGEFLFKPRQERAQTPAHCSWRVEFPPNKYQALGWNSLSGVHCSPAPPLLPRLPSRLLREPCFSRLVGLRSCELCLSPHVALHSPVARACSLLNLLRSSWIRFALVSCQGGVPENQATVETCCQHGDIGQRPPATPGAFRIWQDHPGTLRWSESLILVSLWIEEKGLSSPSHLRNSEGAGQTEAGKAADKRL